ncbi:hypothetical protein ASF12_22210 [Paenibacillus sp. Leaf72]|nr:hypothetical protein ASF12_22210 [Paenibacillus sp. Leaf72]
MELLSGIKNRSCITDGEIFYFDGEKPNFQRVLVGKNRKKFDDSLMYVMFDLLQDDGEDIRKLKFEERYLRLQSKFPVNYPRVFVSDLHRDGIGLWNWVLERGWEGIISKRLDSPYVEGKDHQYWYKKRKEIRLFAEAVGIKLKQDRVSTLILRYDNRYIGQVSVLDQASKRILQEYLIINKGNCPFEAVPSGLKNSNVVWLKGSFSVQISALELTDTGLLRQGKILGYGKK